MLGHLLIHEQQPISNIDMQNSLTSLIFQPCGNSRVGFDSSNTLSGHRPLIISVPFFMLALGLQLVGRVLGGFIPAGFLECRSVNLTPDSPFLFDSKEGEHITLGGSQ